MLMNKASGAVRRCHPPHARPGGGALPTPSEPQGPYTRKRRDVPADAPGRPVKARPAPAPCSKPPRTRGPVRRTACLPSTDPPGATSGPARERNLRPWTPRRTPADAGITGGPQAHRKAGPAENGLASRLDGRGRSDGARPTSAINARRSALGRATTARGSAHLRDFPCRAGQNRRSGPTLSRTGK